MQNIWILAGPNLNLLGQREPEVYGTKTLETIMSALQDYARASHEVEIVSRQTNHEGCLIDWMCEADAQGARAIILNAGALSHTSIALHDTIRGISVPVISVHLSNTASREPFRHQDYVAAAATGSIIGFGADVYRLALLAALEL